jgi:hypothetical protein
MTATTTDQPATTTHVAKRGDLVVFEEHHRDYAIGRGTSEYDTFTVGVVTSVTRDGHVKMYRRAGNFDQGKDWRGQPDRGEPAPSRMVRSYLMSSTEIDVAGAVATAACHVWITDTAHEDHAKPYGSLAEVQGELRPHLKMGYRWLAMRDAAAVWEKARREASPMLTAALAVAYDDRPRYREMSDAYHAAVTAANEAYRAVYAANA